MGKWPPKVYGSRKKPGVMNKLEASYAEYLEELKAQGKVKAYWYEGMRFKLAPNTTWNPDFLVLMEDDSIEIHEVKGTFWRDDARVKIKVCADMYPFKVIAIQRKKKEWVIEEF